jgi:HK97 family phage portal protein
VIQSGGTLAPISYTDVAPTVADQFYYSNTGLSLTSSFATYAQIYKSQVWVYTLVQKVSTAVSRLPLKVYSRASDGARAEARDTPYARLLRNPNPRHDAHYFWNWTASTFEIYGEALWVKVRPSPGAPATQLWPMHPANIYTKRDEFGNLIYTFQLGQGSAPLMEWPESDIVHFKSYNPDNQIRGLSKLEPLRQTLLNEDAARRASAAIWVNGGRPSMTLTHSGNLSDLALGRLKAQWDANHSGVDNWGKTAILEEGMTPFIVPLNAEELQYLDSRRMNREEACGVYDVPPPVVHILDRATFSNITEQMRSMYRDTMAPRLGLYESVLESQLRPDFDIRGDLYAEFLLDEVMRGAFEQRAIATAQAIQSGQMTPNEARQMDNRPPLEGGDKLYINSAAVPLEAAAAEQAPVVEQAPKTVNTIGLDACQMCATYTESLSARALCRSCEGKVGRMLTKENTDA